VEGTAPASAPRIRDGVRAALPLAPSPILFGLSFGVLANASGFGVPATIVMSATTFAGAAQFAAISVLGAGGTVTAAVLAAVFLNARYAAISMTVASIFPGGRCGASSSHRRSSTSRGRSRTARTVRGRSS
jgi:predicted branched-subunit amino acid permease